MTTPTDQVQTPELKKLSAVAKESQKLGSFLEWLQEQGYEICERSTNVECDFCGRQPSEFVRFPITLSIEKLLAKYFEIDMDKVESEKLALLDNLRENQ